MVTFGFREDFKEEEPEKAKGRCFRPRNNGKGKGKRKGKSHLVEDDTHWTQDEWQGNENDNWSEGYWAYEDETAWQSQGWDQWQEYDEYPYFQGKKERKERKEKEKERKVTDFQIKEKDTMMGKVKQNM